MSTETQFAINGPSVWIACLASYNSGILHVAWVNVPETVKEFQEEIDKVIKSSPFPDSEEWAFHDYFDFAPFEVDEWEDMNTLIMKANVLNSLESYEVEAFDKWEYNEHSGDDAQSILDRFRDEYRGEYQSGEDYAFHFYSECYETPEYLMNYINYEMIWTEMTYDGFYENDGHIFCSY